VTSGSLGADRVTFRALPASLAMRSANIARWIDANDGRTRNEPYRPDRKYDVAVFVKAMDDRHRAEAHRIREYGGRVVFDANVNYYEIWGEYDIPGTRPTPEQQAAAVEMTALADHVVADSSYLLAIVARVNANATWIPDNVDTQLFRGRPQRRAGLLRLVWSGMAHKGRHLLSIADVLASLPDVELVVVSNAEPDILPELGRSVQCRFVPFSLRRYAQTLRSCDVIVSPKRLVNGYELAHSEWKITLGMAGGLPAVASPQPSYLEAIGHLGGGIVADSNDDWREGLERLREPQLRVQLGERAQRTVVERYSTPVIARQYRDLLDELL
jgi:glycosyltransferase involved in cell wall biosynthesis